MMVTVVLPAASQAARSSERVVLQLPYTHQFQFAGLYAAKENGYFQAEGIDIEIRIGTLERRPVKEVLADHAQYGIGQSEILIERLNGRPLVVVAAIFQHSPFVLIVKEDSGIATPVDLIGRRIAMSPGLQNVELRAMFQAEGLKPDQFTVVPDRWGRAELAEGDADAATIFLPDVYLITEGSGLKYKLIRPADYGVDFYGDCLFTSEQELADNPERVAAMLRAVQKGWEYALAHPEEVIDWILTRLPEEERTRGLTRAGLQREATTTAGLINADLVEIGHMNPGRWQRMAELAVKTGDVASTARLPGFIYTPAADQSSNWIRWLGTSLVIAAAAALLTLLANRRLQSLVRHRTHQLQVAEQRQREYFELAPAPIVIEDYTGFGPVLDQFRLEGVTDLRAHMQTRPDLVRDIFKHKRVVAANRAALARTGYHSVEDMDRNLAEVMSEQAMIMFIEELDAIWRGKDRLTLEKIYHTKLGETIHTLINWEVGQKDGGRDLANVRLVFTEITERKLAEEALRRSEERYRELFEQAVGGIYQTSPEGRFLSANPALAKILGYGQPGEKGNWFEGINLESLYVQPGRREQYIAALNTRGVLNDFESEVRHRGGGTVWISENARAVRDAHGRLLYYEGFVTDISARRQLESEIGRASKLEALGILAGGIAHDFNNILTVVLGNVSLAEGELGADHPVVARLSEAKRATLRARDLTLQLLTFAKGGEPVRTTVELPGLVRESSGFALHGAKARGEFHFAPGLWPVNADRGQLGQVVQNLVINAVQAMPGGGVITVSAGNEEITEPTPGGPPLPPGRYVQLAVADTGVGISPENLAKIFDPYFTTKEHGTGLGLASVYSIVRRHEGHIVVESEPGLGARFRVWLPAAVSAFPGATSDSGSRTTGSLSPFRVRVLFMDDEPSIRSMAVHFMQRIGYACEVATNGTEAVQKYQEAMAAGEKYGLVVMDLTVPGAMGGREAMEILRRIDPGVRAIVSSGYSRDPVLANYQAHGFQAVLAKPYGIDQLAKVMREALDGSGGAA